MSITIGKPCAVCEKGGRANNEDCVFPEEEYTESGQRLFLVCDGVGGAERGEVASALACEAIRTYFDTFLGDADPTADFIQRALRYTETRFDAYLQAHPEAKGMATTLTLAYIGRQGITLAHIGDSRIYYIRHGKALYRSEDHTLVNQLVQLGRITPEEARKHPQRHQITRAIQGSHCPTEAEIVCWEEVQTGDWLFLCTDGALEQVEEPELLAFFAQAKSPAEIKEQLLERCAEKNRDNYSFFIIPLVKREGPNRLTQNFLSFFYSFL